MIGDGFFKTRMGQTFFERTLPNLVHAIQTLSAELKALHNLGERWLTQSSNTMATTPEVAASPESTKSVYGDTVYTGSRGQPVYGQRVRICGVFREHTSVSIDFAGLDRPPAHVQRRGDVSADCWAYVVSFSSKGWMNTSLDAVSVLDLECFAHLLPSPSKGQP